MPSDPFIGAVLAPVPTAPLWLWDTTGAIPIVSGYPQASGFAPTKTGLLPADLQGFVGVPLVYYGNPPVAVPPSTIQQWIRWAEDSVEQQTSILLCQSWIASPPSPNAAVTSQLGLVLQSSGGYQIQGRDFDLFDAAYDFQFKNAQDEGWMAQTLRYRPVQSTGYNPLDSTAIKNTSYVYPLLNQYFRMPRSWNVEDRDFGFVRFVPSTNTQMLPLFAMQLAFMGYAESVPGAIWFQYTAGLTPFDYQGRWSFMKQLVLAEAAVMALASIQGTINLGVLSIDTMVDGLRQQMKYSEKGPYGGLIDTFGRMRDELLKRARAYTSGPMMTFI